jgi:hypothetical protein
MKSWARRSLRAREATLAVLGTLALGYVPLRLIVLHSPEFRDAPDWTMVLAVFVGGPFVCAFLPFYRMVAVANERPGIATAILAASVATVPWSAAFGLFWFEPRLMLWPYSFVFALAAVFIAPRAFRAAAEHRFWAVLRCGVVAASAAFAMIWCYLFLASSIG